MTLDFAHSHIIGLIVKFNELLFKITVFVSSHLDRYILYFRVPPLNDAFSVLLIPLMNEN